MKSYESTRRRLEELERQVLLDEGERLRRMSDEELKALVAESEAYMDPELRAALDTLSEKELELTVDGLLDEDDIRRLYRRRQGDKYAL